MLTFNFIMAITGIFMSGIAFGKEDYSWFVISGLIGIFYSIAAIGSI